MKKISITILLLLLTTLSFGSSLDKVNKGKVLKVGTTGDYKPFTYNNDGIYEGYDIEVAKKIARELGVEVEFVSTTWKDLTKDLNEGKFHIAMGGITKTVTRQKIAEQTSPYIVFGKCFLVNKINKNRYKSLEDLDKKGNRIGMNLGGTNESFAKANIKNADLIYFEDNLDVPVAVANGSIDAMVTESPEAILYERENPKLVALLEDNPLTKNQFGYLIKKNDYEMLNMINFILEELELRGELKELREQFIK